MRPEIRLLEVVAITEDIPSDGLRRGHVSTVVEKVAPDVFEVEFSDDHGRTYAIAAVPADHLLVLHHVPTRAA
jgi:hypothetical protein